MRRLLAVKFLLLAAVAALSQTPQSAQVDALMAQWSQGNSPGAAIVVIRDGKILHKKGYGLADLEGRAAISPDTAFDIASVSKQFTAMAVMMLAEQEKLSYADPLSKFFPEFPPYARHITIRHLLNHTSGLPDYLVFWEKSPRINKGSAVYDSEDVVRFLAAQKKPEFAPGEKWKYSNSGYVLLTQIVARVSGASFPRFVKENIFAPLGMRDSYVYDDTRRQAPARAVGYILNGGRYIRADHNPNNFVAGDGAIYSTAEDMCKWDHALYSEKLVRSAALKEAFTSGSLNDGTKINYGFGWGLGKYLGAPVVSHSGGADGFVAHIGRFPGERFTVIVMSNFEQLTPPAYTLANKIAGIYLADKLAPPAAVQTNKNLKDYAATYGLYDIGVKITVENDALWITARKNKKAKLTAVAEDEFIAEGGDSETSYGFNRNAKGMVTGMTILGVNGLFLSRLSQ